MQVSCRAEPKPCRCVSSPGPWLLCDVGDFGSGRALTCQSFQLLPWTDGRTTVSTASWRQTWTQYSCHLVQCRSNHTMLPEENYAESVLSILCPFFRKYGFPAASEMCACLCVGHWLEMTFHWKCLWGPDTDLQQGRVKVAVILQAGSNVLERPFLTSCFFSAGIGRVIKGDKPSLLIWSHSRSRETHRHIDLQWQLLLVWLRSWATWGPFVLLEGRKERTNERTNEPLSETSDKTFSLHTWDLVTLSSWAVWFRCCSGTQKWQRKLTAWLMVYLVVLGHCGLCRCSHRSAPHVEAVLRRSLPKSRRRNHRITNALLSHLLLDSKPPFGVEADNGKKREK